MHRGVPHFDTRIKTDIPPVYEPPRAPLQTLGVGDIQAMYDRIRGLRGAQSEFGRIRPNPDWSDDVIKNLGLLRSASNVSNMDWLAQNVQIGGRPTEVEYVASFPGSPNKRGEYQAGNKHQAGKISAIPSAMRETPGRIESHEALHEVGLLLQINPELWSDVEFFNPDTNQTVNLYEFMTESVGASPHRSAKGDAGKVYEEWDYTGPLWNNMKFHDAIYSAEPYGLGQEQIGRKTGMSPEAASSLAAALNVASSRLRSKVEAEANDSLNFDTFSNRAGPGSTVWQDAPGLLSDKMSNEDWVQFIMGRGAEEERKTEVSKQKVEAKRQAQVAEVKKEKEAEKKPSTVREAKAQGSLYFWDSKGNKKLALTAEDVKKFKASDKYDPEGKGALTQMANIGKKEGIEGLLTTAPSKPKDVEVPKAEKKGYNFRNNWEKYYYAGKPKGDEYMEGFQARLSSKKAIPDKAKEAIEIAVDIFGGDKDKNGKRYSADRLRKDLQNIGRVESQYRKKESTVGGTEKGWWQVKPSTAKDALKNAKKHFGKKFNKHFKKYGGYDGLLDRAQKGTLAALMLKDEQLAAAFAAVQVIRTFDQE